ncbi:nSTAND3 domain-containing NTPase [Flavitalea antarctica]
MISANSIYDRERLNSILSQFPQIEKKYFKLWISSSNVLTRILHNSVNGRSEFYEQKIRANIKKYVSTKAFADAIRILKKHHYLMITGQPGVGKTTLAQIVIYSMLSKSYQLVVVERDLKEAEEAITSDPDAKQIFYLDDFLGSTYFDIIHPKTTDGLLVNFLERITKSTNKFLILTTRTTILNSAYQLYEKINQSAIHLGRKELELVEYSDLDKARILYNHLFHSKISRTYMTPLFANESYLKIIKHQNYNPRLIEFVTDNTRFSQSGNQDYLQFVSDMLNNPKEIWKQSITNQIKDEDRFLLFTLLSLGGTAHENVIQFAFKQKLEYEVSHSGFTKTFNTYVSVLERLLDGHITRTKSGYESNFILKFINPSLEDFLSNFLLESLEERRKVWESAVYIEQLERIYRSILVLVFQRPGTFNEQTDLLNFIKTHRFVSMTDFGERQAELTKCKIIVVFQKLTELSFLREKIDALCAERLSNIDFNNILNFRVFDMLIATMQNGFQGGKVYQFFKVNWEIISNTLWSNITIPDDIDDVINIFKYYSEDLAKYLLETPNRSNVLERISTVASQVLADEASYRKSSIKTSDDQDSLADDLRDIWEDNFTKVKLPPPRFDVEEYLPDIEESDNYHEWEKDNESDNNLTDIVKHSPRSVRTKQTDYSTEIKALFEQ